MPDAKWLNYPAYGCLDPRKNEQPFDGYDSIAEGVTEPHSHPQIPATYKPGTGFSLMAAAIIITAGSGGAFYSVRSLKVRTKRGLRRILKPS